jgi:hypothetical protein
VATPPASPWRSTPASPWPTPNSADKSQMPDQKRPLTASRSSPLRLFASPWLAPSSP